MGGKIRLHYTVLLYEPCPFVIISWRFLSPPFSSFLLFLSCPTCFLSFSLSTLTSSCPWLLSVCLHIVICVCLCVVNYILTTVHSLWLFLVYCTSVNCSVVLLSLSLLFLSLRNYLDVLEKNEQLIRELKHLDGTLMQWFVAMISLLLSWAQLINAAYYVHFAWCVLGILCLLFVDQC